MKTLENAADKKVGSKRPGLKPCPFCGARPRTITWFRTDKPAMYQIQCENQFCEIQPMTFYHTNKAVVVRKWNRRNDE